MIILSRISWYSKPETIIPSCGKCISRLLCMHIIMQISGHLKRHKVNDNYEFIRKCLEILKIWDQNSCPIPNCWISEWRIIFDVIRQWATVLDFSQIYIGFDEIEVTEFEFMSLKPKIFGCIGLTSFEDYSSHRSSLESKTRMIYLNNTTRVDAASDFFGEEHVPKRAITMGLSTIMKVFPHFLKNLLSSTSCSDLD